MNTMKKNGGFTLVELIIVIAILAILSTGAIAGYSAYIKSANNAAVEAILNDISTSAVLANAKAGTIDSIVVVNDTKTTGNISVTITAASLDESTTNGFKYFFEESIDGATVTVTPGANGAADQATFSIPAPQSWTNSDYATTGATWDGTGWEVTE